MTTYRAGQRVRIEWPDGSAVEGVLMDVAMARYALRTYCDTVQAEQDGATVTVLAEPRPAEPIGLGAVVHDGAGVLHVRIWDVPYPWMPVGAPIAPSRWEQLPLPITIRSEGWTP